ncbi:MAG: hypothetical protein V1717_01785 [Candidatus Micrarchaeota archaeon]
MARILVCFISNNPVSLELSLYAHSTNFTPETKVLVLDTPNSHEQNKKLAGEFNAIHVSEDEFKKSVPDAFKILFQGKYGGNRNACLYYAFKEKAHAVFFDDDTTPYENPIGRYSELFGEGKKIVVGKYLRHATGAPQIIKEVIDTLEAYADKQLVAEEAQEKLLQLFSGVPMESDSPPRGMGVVGGNVGIHYDCLKKYCFFPTDYRVEDGTYGVLAKYFVEEEPFNREGNPAVFHNKKSRENALLSNLENELKGNVIALCVKDSLEENEFSMESVEEKINRNANSSSKDST